MFGGYCVEWASQCEIFIIKYSIACKKTMGAKWEMSIFLRWVGLCCSNVEPLAQFVKTSGETADCFLEFKIHEEACNFG